MATPNQRRRVPALLLTIFSAYAKLDAAEWSEDCQTERARTFK